MVQFSVTCQLTEKVSVSPKDVTEIKRLKWYTENVVVWQVIAHYRAVTVRCTTTHVRNVDIGRRLRPADERVVLVR